MKINQLEQIVEVSICGSINKAAQKLFISQSALVSSLNAAEEEIGQSIFIRSKRGITLTDYGKEFVKGAENILAIWNKLLDPNEERQETQLRISSQYLRYASTIFSEVIQESEHPGSEYRFLEKGPSLVCQDILDGTSDVGIIVTPTFSRGRIYQALKASGVSVHVLDTTPARCLVGKGSPLYYREDNHVSLSELAEYPLLHYEQTPWIWGESAFAEEREFFPHSSTLAISDSGSFQHMLNRTKCYFVGIHPETAYKSRSFYQDIRILDFADAEFTFDTIWLSMQNYRLTPIARSFLRKLYLAVGADPNKMHFHHPSESV